MEPIQLQLDVRLHRSLPFLQGGGHLHAITPAGEKRRFNIAETKAFSSRDLWGMRTDTEEVGITTDGRWVLVRTTEGDALVWEFATRDELCHYLWELRDDDPSALITLNYLGALRLDTDGTELGTEGATR